MGIFLISKGVRMKKRYCLEKFENYESSDGYELFVRGWYLTKNHESLNVEVYADNSPVSADVTIISRPDVLNSLQAPDSTVHCGFIIKAKMSEKTKEMKLVLNGETVLELKGLEFERSVLKDDFMYDFTLRQEGDALYRVAGFAASPENGKVNVYLVDGDNKKIDQQLNKLPDYKSPFYFDEHVRDAGFDIVFCHPDNKNSVHLVLEKDSKQFTIPLSMSSSRPEILMNNFSVLGIGRIYPLWKANGSRFLARRLFRHELYSIVDAQAETKWYRENTPTQNDLAKQKNTKFSYEPLISLVCAAYHTDLKYLNILIRSLNQQSYSNWELCIADGSEDRSVEEYVAKKLKDNPKIRYKRIGNNLGIAGNTNEAIKMAEGDFIGFIDHDDSLRPDALFEVVKAINEKDPDFVYTDEDKIINKKGELGNLFFKPDYSPDYLFSCNYINHFSVVRKSILDRIGLLRSEYDGAQDYDFLLRMIEIVPAEKIVHVSKPVYHWRMTEDSTALNPESKRWAFDAGRRAIQDYMDRNGKNAVVSDGPYLGTYMVKYKMQEYPMISIIIPNKDHIGELEVLLSSIQEKVSYPNYEILVVENNSKEEATFRFYETIESKFPKVRLLHWEDEFNYSAINNYAVRQSQGEIILLMNNDMEIIDGDLLDGMASNALRDEVGAVGIKLLYKNGRIQHNGVLWGIEGGYHLFLEEEVAGNSYGNLKMVQHDVAGVTGAALMVTKKKYWEVGGLDERYQVAYNDVDFCLKLLDAGYYNVILPQYSMYHYESLSRGLEDTPEKLNRFYSELDRLTDTWTDHFEHGDPYYNENLSLTRGYYTPRTLDEQSDYEILKNARKKRDIERKRLDDEKE